jgi:hypothetical protein
LERIRFSDGIEGECNAGTGEGKEDFTAETQRTRRIQKKGISDLFISLLCDLRVSPVNLLFSLL